MKITKSQLREIIREEIQKIRLSEKIDVNDFNEKWDKAMRLLKSKGGWSPHFKTGSGDVGNTNSDFWNKVPKKYDGQTVIGFHSQSSNRAFRNGYWVSPLFLNWTGDAALIHKVLRSAGFKTTGGKTEDDKIVIQNK